MSTPKRHHTVPRVYLKQFVDDDQRLTVWSKRRQTRLRPIPTKALIRGYYYSQPENGQVNANHYIETKLLNEIETRYPEFVKSILMSEPTVDVELLVHTLLSLRARSSAFREAFELGLADLVERTANSIPKSMLPKPPEGYKNIIDSLAVSIDPHRSLIAMAFYIKRYAVPLIKFEYSPRYTSGNMKILTSDNSVIWYNKGYGNKAPVIYPQNISQNTRAVLPISQNCVLVGVPSQSGDLRYNPSIRELSRLQVREINELQLACSWDEVVGTATLPDVSWKRFGKVAPRIDVGSYNAESGQYLILDTYLDLIRQKYKFTDN